MKVALVNPPWDFQGSVYFGCREPHLPLELGYAKALLEEAGHEALLVDCQLLGLDLAELRRRVAAFAPDLSVAVTAPSYLFWRCPPPELREPRLALDALRGVGGLLAVAGPHPSVTPAAAEAKLDADLVLRGELEPITAFMAAGEYPPDEPLKADLRRLSSLAWPDDWIARHVHQHHRFDAAPRGLGAEVEASRGCPFACSFCAKESFRGSYRRRDRGVVLAEIDGLLNQGVEYVYFIDEIFLPDRLLLEDLAARKMLFGVQTRVDLWEEDELELLGRAGCVSVEAGVESLTREGRDALGKRCSLSTEEISRRLVHAKRFIPFVQANLVRQPGDDPALAARWRDELRAKGVWANDPVPLFPYPGSPAYRERFGPPDDLAWERAHASYLAENERLCDLQTERPKPLDELESVCGSLDVVAAPGPGRASGRAKPSRRKSASKRAGATDNTGASTRAAETARKRATAPSRPTGAADPPEAPRASAEPNPAGGPSRTVGPAPAAASVPAAVSSRAPASGRTSASARTAVPNRIADSNQTVVSDRTAIPDQTVAPGRASVPDRRLGQDRTPASGQAPSASPTHPPKAEVGLLPASEKTPPAPRLPQARGPGGGHADARPPGAGVQRGARPPWPPEASSSEESARG